MVSISQGKKNRSELEKRNQKSSLIFYAVPISPVFLAIMAVSAILTKYFGLDIQKIWRRPAGKQGRHLSIFEYKGDKVFFAKIITLGQWPKKCFSGLFFISIFYFLFILEFYKNR